MKRKSQDCKSRLPDNSAMKQQQLPAFRLQLSANEILSGFFATGVFCLGMGVILLLSAKSIREIEINYTEKCASCAKLREDATNFDKECNCSISFYLPQKMEGNVYLYYKLYGFYQNLYRYILSRSNIQLVGTDVKDVRNCAPFKTSDEGLPIAPCGAIANSLFNDTFVLLYNFNSSTQIKVPMVRTATAWWTDKYVKFQNPTYQNLSHAFEGGFLTIELPEKFIHMQAPKTVSVSIKILLPTTIEVFGRANISTVFGEEVSPAKGTAKPPNWPKPVYELDEEDPRNNGFINDDFIVWMRTAAFPTFKKLHRRLHRIDNFTEGLPAGSYSFIINYNFPVSKFQGQKALVLSTLTWSGGSSLFLGLAYLVTGAVTLLAFFSMMAVHLKLKERKTFFLQ